MPVPSGQRKSAQKSKLEKALDDGKTSVAPPYRCLVWQRVEVVIPIKNKKQPIVENENEEEDHGEQVRKMDKGKGKQVDEEEDDDEEDMDMDKVKVMDKDDEDDEDEEEDDDEEEGDTENTEKKKVSKKANNYESEDNLPLDLLDLLVFLVAGCEETPWPADGAVIVWISDKDPVTITPNSKGPPATFRWIPYEKEFVLLILASTFSPASIAGPSGGNLVHPANHQSSGTRTASSSTSAPSVAINPGDSSKMKSHVCALLGVSASLARGLDGQNVTLKNQYKMYLEWLQVAQQFEEQKSNRHWPYPQLTASNLWELFLNKTIQQILVIILLPQSVNFGLI
ncbi:hypothetical protein FA15DRAFT_710691 [Coprinopsis marcescibilis]|uniref:Uncharacterized protein n=1 Tax=Coprinopsis marcescibilis TaxID=230819 RepID=A0A5C3KCA7_COPMA|nr:hypothetical protein FA15DRAFT_710691 [Coprinopsis marcescibilis]